MKSKKLSWEYRKYPLHFYFCHLVTKLCLTLCNPLDCSTPGSLSSIISWSLLKLMSIESMMPSNHLILCHPLLLPIQSFPALGSFPMSRLFTLGGQNIGSFSISPSNEYSGLISFRIDWFESLAVQGTLKSVLQHHS